MIYKHKYTIKGTYLYRITIFMMMIIVVSMKLHLSVKRFCQYLEIISSQLHCDTSKVKSSSSQVQCYALRS